MKPRRLRGFFMKKFLYLRIMAITSAVLLAVFMVGMLLSWHNYSKRGELLSFFGSEAIFGILLCHCILSIVIYHKYYPANEIPRIVILFYRLAEVGCWLCLLILLGATIALTFSEDDFITSVKENYRAIIVGIIFLVVFIVQLAGGRKLTKTIRENARLELENSFV